MLSNNMERRRFLTVIVAFSLLINALCAPTHLHRLRRDIDDFENSNNLEENSENSTTSTATKDTIIEKNQSSFDDDDDDDDDFDDFGDAASKSSGGGSNIFSLLNLLPALFPGSSSSSVAPTLLSKNRSRNQLFALPIRREFMDDNENEIGSISVLKPPSQIQQNDDINASKNSDSKSRESEDDKAQEESAENNQDSAPNLDSDGDNADNSDYDFDEPPGGGDGEGGGVLGLLAGLSGGEDGQSDLGSLLATVSGIVVNLSGDGIDLNSLIASGIGLFAGLLSEGEENPGSVIASYLLTSLDTLTGGGAKNNGAFFGNFLSKLVKGTSAPSHRESEGRVSPFQTLKLDISRALLQFGISLLGLASSSSFHSSSG
ncbi:unnamed protein product [Parnassius apollo]|uniref:(apollo) hypothetical protein n=1 Tax=Parnassius apollo TaxID=110799 RepID=A0A8S3XGG4_PARAO|nr:unnamed protein product [Parnassius apollo]